MSVPATTERAILSDLAALFAYPRGDVAGIARHCVALLGSRGAAAAALRNFADWAGSVDAGEMEEVYSATFDLDPACAPYVGWQICPDPERRNLFLSGLAAVYSREGFQPREELGDHLAEVLRFLAVSRDEQARGTLLHEGVAPAARRMASSFDAPSNPYRWLVAALAAWVAPGAAERPARAQEARP